MLIQFTRFRYRLAAFALANVGRFFFGLVAAYRFYICRVPIAISTLDSVRLVHAFHGINKGFTVIEGDADELRMGIIAFSEAFLRAEATEAHQRIRGAFIFALE